MKLSIVVLLVCVSLTQAFISWNKHQKHAQRVLEEVEDKGLHFANKERRRNKVDKLWMKFKNIAAKNLENAKESIDEMEEELNSSLPEHAKNVMKDVRHQTRHIVKSLKKLINPIKLQKAEFEFETSEFVEPESTEEPEEPEVFPENELPAGTTEVPEFFPTGFLEPTEELEAFSTDLPEPEFLPTEVPDSTEEPYVLPTEFLETTEEPEVLPTEFLETTEEPEVLPTEFLETTEEPEVLSTEVPDATEEPEVLPTEPIDEEDFIDEGDDDDHDEGDDETMLAQQEEYDENEDENDDGDDNIDEDSTEVPTEKEPEKVKEVHEVVEFAQNIGEEVKIMPKWLNKRQKKLTKLWEKYTLRNSERVLGKIKRLESILTQKTQEAN